MRKILLLSDTHGYIDAAMCNYARQADEIWHAGDIGALEVFEKLNEIRPVRAVAGNIDGKEIRAVCPQKQRFQCEKKDVLITHIGGYPPRYTPPLLAELKRNPPGIFICGHSHILKVMYDKKLGLLHINPGAAGRHGFHHIRTMIRFNITEEEITNMEIIELGKRTDTC